MDAPLAATVQAESPPPNGNTPQPPPPPNDRTPMPAKVKTLFIALAGLATAIIALLTTFQIVHWTASQVTLVSAEAAAVIGLACAVTMHLLPSTKREPVAVAATITAAVSATLALGTGFGWWHLSAEQIGALVGVLTAVVGVGSAILARQMVTPTTGSE